MLTIMTCLIYISFLNSCDVQKSEKQVLLMAGLKFLSFCFTYLPNRVTLKDGCTNYVGLTPDGCK